MIFIFFEFFMNFILFGVLHQAVRAVLKKRPKPPMLDTPFNFNITIFILHLTSKENTLNHFFGAVSWPNGHYFLSLFLC
jgi:hypothetical protein